MVVSVALQGLRQSKEAIPPEPFASPFNAVSRIFREQCVMFARFVQSDGCLWCLQRPDSSRRRSQTLGGYAFAPSSQG